MHLKYLKVKNFRALEDIHVEFDSHVNVIVGPNAAGKTTVLEAVRLLKAMLAPRLQNEAIQVLQSLGAASPHLPNQMRFQSIARDMGVPVVIGCRFSLSDQEIAILESGVDSIAPTIVQSQMGQAFAAPGAMIGFLSSDQGKQMLVSVKAQLLIALEKIKASKTCNLELTVSEAAGPSASSDPIEMHLVAFIERQLPPYKTIFTYFPADRALPSGEQPVQLGGPDASQQLESYNSQPQIKFNRLKNTIFSAAIIGEGLNPADSLKVQFEKIFNGILKGRKLLEFGVNEIGFLSVLIQDTENGRIFDLDGMSSGEKGLILTFLLIARSVAQDGIILFDEPELHLNPAVCKDLLAYLINEYVIPRNLQIFICSHSLEILAGALDNDYCSLYHLISSTTLSKVRQQDEITLGDALRRLGVSESENLLYRGIIFVEGPDDVALLESGFSTQLRRYKLKFSSGRAEVEKAIKALQQAEVSGIHAAPTYFIFDRDELPTNLTSSVSVKVLQWDRRCLENYLIDLDAISNALMDDEVAKEPFTNQGDVSRLLRELAFQQLEEVAAKKVYSKYAFEGLGIRREDLVNRSIDDVSETLLARIQNVKNQISEIDINSWRDEFKNKVIDERKQLEGIWETTWQSDCDGKRLLYDLSRKVKLRINLKKLKVRLMREISINNSPTWNTIKGNIHTLLTEA